MTVFTGLELSLGIVVVRAERLGDVASEHDPRVSGHRRDFLLVWLYR